jgi:hypothetical protein
MFRKRGLVVLLWLLLPLFYGLLPAALQGQFAQRSSISGFVTVISPVEKVVFRVP